MLLTFSVTNYRSIKETETLSLIAGRERKNSQRLTAVKVLRKRVVPLAMIQGKNGAGKSNIIKALSTAIKTISLTRQTGDKLDVIPFRLCNNCLNKPTEFMFEFMICDSVFRYAFSVTRDSIQKELLQIVKASGKTTLYERQAQSINSNGLTTLDEERNDLRFIAQGTRNNQLFLNALAQQAENVSGYSWSALIHKIFEWLTKGISILEPNMNITLSDSGKIAFLSKTIPLFDTGISSVDLVELTRDSVNIAPSFLQNLLDFMPEGSVFPLAAPKQGLMFIRKVNGEAHFFEVNTSHKNNIGESIHFHLNDESDGTFRLMSLLTLLSSLANQTLNKVIVIDEIDRSLHTTLTEKILKDFLSWVEITHAGQLIFTSHDPMLMNEAIGLRRDEMWIADKTPNGETRLHSVSSKNIQRSGEPGLRSGMDLVGEYLAGQLGGIAKIQEVNFLNNKEL